MSAAEVVDYWLERVPYLDENVARVDAEIYLRRPPGYGIGYLNGVNSHKRCRTHCGSPPTATAGVFWQEMSSPPFLRSTGNTDESEDVFVDCLNQE